MQILNLLIGSPINTSLQIGDYAYFSSVGTVPGSGFSTAGQVRFFGVVSDIDHEDFRVMVAYDNTAIPSIPTPINGDYIMFGKNKAVNSSNVKGYYAEVKFVNYRTDEIELFSIGSEISQSSK
tara:strand:+ start:98 stop:466 length:369 start_codon:yes stop_codon:yes gene_type:complete